MRAGAPGEFFVFYFVFFFFYLFVSFFRGRGLFFSRWLGVALHSELGAQMAPKKPRPLQAASGKCTPQQLEATPRLRGTKGVPVELKADEGEYGA